MDDLFLLAFLACALVLIVGMIKPRLVVRWGDEGNRTRGKVFKSYGILMIIFFVGFGMTTEAPAEPVAPSDPVVENVVPETTPTPDEVPQTFEDEVIAAIGDSVHVNSIEVDEYSKDLYITVEMSDNITNNLIKLGMEKSAAHVFETVFPLLEEREDVDMITYVSETVFIDKYGNESIDDACIISMNKETYNKINWENFLTDNLKSVATSYYLHPTFNQ